MHYFAKEVDKGRSVHKVISPKIDRNGRIDTWPDGFFDEWDNALNHLIMPAAE
jgi:predicted ATPase